MCEASETTTVEAFRSWGFKPIPVPFRGFLPFGTFTIESIHVYLFVSISHQADLITNLNICQAGLFIVPLSIFAASEIFNLISRICG